jgi:SprT protein
MRQPEPKETFDRYFPASLTQYCQNLWLQYPFRFKIARHRRSRLGDYRYSKESGHEISVNGTLNPYAFAFTYLHEVAHLLTQQERNNWPAGKRKPVFRPHGPEWKRHFRELMQPLLSTEAFPLPLRTALQRHMRNPSASSGADPALVAAFRAFDSARIDNKILLSDLNLGEAFHLNGRTFVKETTRRTRALCLELKSRRKYTVSEAAWVEKAEDTQ